MSVLIPIGIGILSSIVIFTISMFILKNAKRSTTITLFVGLLTLIVSLIIGGWSGMGLGVISIGMLFASVCLYVYTFITHFSVKSSSNA